MRFSAIVLSTLVAAVSVSAQNATSTTAAVVSGTAGVTPAQSSEAACLVACPANDNDCRSKCIPQGDTTNGIADCITACPKGNGTATDNLNYQNCVKQCISSGAASATASPTASGTSSAGNSGSTATGTSPGAGSGTSATGSAAGGSGSASSTASAATTSKSSAAENIQIGASVLGAAGLFAALFAL